jgi:hypothetical protein
VYRDPDVVNWRVGEEEDRETKTEIPTLMHVCVCVCVCHLLGSDSFQTSEEYLVRSLSQESDIAAGNESRKRKFVTLSLETLKMLDTPQKK